MVDPAVYTLLAIFIPGGTVGTILGLAAIYYGFLKEVRSRELAADLITQMLNRKMSVEEIERLLLAWSQDPELAKTISKTRKLLGEAKAAPHLA
jgi:ATP phosphoribosyltransferase regulatory subunit HisZ